MNGGGPVVDLVLLPDTKIWHIRNGSRSACGLSLSLPMSHMKCRIEKNVDAHVVAQRGKPVCVRCRRRLTWK